jgi:hypothetical protein
MMPRSTPPVALRLLLAGAVLVAVVAFGWVFTGLPTPIADAMQEAVYEPCPPRYAVARSAQDSALVDGVVLRPRSRFQRAITCGDERARRDRGGADGGIGAGTGAMAGARGVAAQDTMRCAAAAQFLREQRRMVAEVAPDTIDDWRTRRRLAGCTVTAAGGTDLDVAREAARLYEAIRAAGWRRSPDPRDAPGEASLRFRMGDADCLFNVNREAMLFTDAETRVNDALVLPPGAMRYQVYVMCLPALPAGEAPPADAPGSLDREDASDRPDFV